MTLPTTAGIKQTAGMKANRKANTEVTHTKVVRETNYIRDTVYIRDNSSSRDNMNIMDFKSSRSDSTLYQERAVFGKMKMGPAKWTQTQNAGEVSSLLWFFSQSVELMTDKVWLHCIRPMLLKERKLIC
jgi:hypothetical protein